MLLYLRQFMFKDRKRTVRPSRNPCPGLGPCSGNIRDRRALSLRSARSTREPRGSPDLGLPARRPRPWTGAPASLLAEPMATKSRLSYLP